MYKRQVKNIEKGRGVSYGQTFVADKPMTIATIPVGYGDGYPRNLSNKGYVLINGKKCNILGRVCMDQFMVDVTEMCIRERTKSQAKQSIHRHTSLRKLMKNIR